jgi:hypothetical protein
LQHRTTFFEATTDVRAVRRSPCIRSGAARSPPPGRCSAARGKQLTLHTGGGVFVGQRQ